MLRIKRGKELVSVITREALESLHIEERQIVIAIVKSSTVFLSGTKDGNSKENRLQGIVSKIDIDAQSAKVVLDIGGHDTIVSVMPIEVFEKMELYEGSSVEAVIHANDIMIGT